MGYRSLDSEQSASPLSLIHEAALSRGVLPTYAGLFSELAQVDYEINTEYGSIAYNSRREFLTPVTITDSPEFLANIQHLSNIIQANYDHPFREWYHYQLLPRSIRNHGFEYRKHLDTIGTPRDIFEGIFAHCPDGDKMYPEFRVRGLIESLRDPIITTFPTEFQYLGTITQMDAPILGRITTPSHVLKHIQDTPFELQLSIGTPDSFSSRLHNARFLPMGSTGVLLSSIQVPDYQASMNSDGISEHDWACIYIECTNQGEGLFHLFNHSFEMQQILGSSFVNKYEFKSKPVYHIRVYEEILQSIAQLPKIPDEVVLTSLRECLSYARGVLNDLPQAHQQFIQGYCVDDIRDVLQRVRANPRVDGHTYNINNIRSISTAIDALSRYAPELPEKIKESISIIQSFHDRCLALYGLSIVEAAFADPTKELTALMRYEERRKTMQMLNRPFRGKGSPSERISTVCFIQAMADMGYTYFYIHTKDNRWPTHKEILMDEKLKRQKDFLVDFVLGLANDGGCNIQSIHHGVYYKINLQELSSHVRAKTKYPSISF